ncbi:hypothetical protein HY032_01235, partial [Candidatus Gottesmanbacteria bacterium]|nr:hypothetical protein [Candidatus Gottesmanbacteria bacterium]
MHQWIALAGALFYQYNLATIQMFYTPLEAFSAHFAALPWLAWSLLTYLHEGSRKRFLIFLLISVLSTPQFFIPTLLLPITVLLTSISIGRLIHLPGANFFHLEGVPRRILLAGLGFLLVNAFWLLPYLYGLPRNAPVITAAKINQMSSGEVFARNQAFGDLGNVLRMRGFPLDFEDTDAAGATTYLMAPWREFLSHPLVQAFSWLSVALTLIGVISIGTILISAASKITPIERWMVLPFAMTLGAALVFLANDTPIVKDLTQLVRGAVPWFAEAYRFPFTKFSLLYGLSSSVLFTVAVAWAVRQVSKRWKKATVVVPFVAAVLTLGLSLPTFRGNFFSERLRVTLPDDYPHVFTWMKDKPPGRVAYLPQHQYWSWKYYQWGYRGSGFAWYGLNQPLLDRAFDPWSGYNENYYWELSRSIYSKDTQSLLTVLDKHDVRYLLLDENIISPSNNRALFIDEIKAMLASLPVVKEVARFGKLTVYEKGLDSRLRGNDNQNTQSFVSLKPNLPTVSPAYEWTDNDVAFEDVGDYIAISDKREVISNTNYTYPFRSLFTKRSAGERDFTIEET